MATPITRITSGNWRGQRITIPAGQAVRPTTAMVRLALFNRLGRNVVENALVLDLFAGGGTLAFEALSRGAKQAILVENDRHAVAAIRYNLERFKCAETSQLIISDVVSWLSGRPLQVAAADVCFIDPPYQQDALLKTALRLLSSEPPTLVVCEHHRNTSFPDEMGGLRKVITSEYGTTALSFFRRQLDSDESK